jgi:putative colanic acid biosynthesis UDP-glucose lipid carrier transferase
MMTPPEASVTSRDDIVSIPDTVHVRRHGRRWPLSYGSIEWFVCALDVFIIIVTSLVAGLTYNVVIHEGAPDVVRHVVSALIVCAVFVPMIRDANLYSPTALMNFTLQARNIIVYWGTTFLFLAGIAFALKIGRDFSRGAIASFAAVGLVAMLAHRAFWRTFIEAALRDGTLRGRKIVLVSMHRAAKEGQVVRTLTRDLARHGFDIQRVFALSTGVHPKQVVDQAIAFARGSDVEEVFFAADMQRWLELEPIVRRFGVLPLPVTLVPDDSVAHLFQRPARKFDGTIAVEFQRPPLTITERLLKRLVDIVCSAVALVLLMPLFLIVALVVKLDSPGPVLFRQTRHGFNGKPFRILKFRTMTVLEDGATVRQAARHDARITQVGLWLRRTSIDELPQLVNVLKGDMSIVGPRPHAAAHDSHYAKLISNYAFRHHVKPGITGWAQVNGFRGQTPTVQAMRERVDFDIWYINNWNLLLDVLIMLRTAREIIHGHNAY